MAQGDIIALTLDWQYDSDPTGARNVIHYEQTENNDVGQTDEEAYREGATDLVTVFNDASPQGTWKEVTPNVIALTGVEFFGITKPEIGGRVAADVDGGATGQPISLRSAVIARKDTGMRGRSFAGRIFLPTPSETVQDAGTLTGDAVTAWQTTLNEILELNNPVLRGPAFSAVVYSPTRAAAGMEPFFAAMTGWTVRGTVGTIRNRQDVS